MTTNNQSSTDATTTEPAATKRQMTHDECFRELGYCFPSSKKWAILSVVFLLQLSMNFNTSVYPNAVPLVAEAFGTSEFMARAAMGGCLIAYGIGSELWAPWSEEFGRWKILQLSLTMVNVLQFMSIYSNNISCMIASRTLLGLASAGGSVTLGMVADMWRPDEQQQAVAFIVFSSVTGASMGPIFGGFMQDYAPWQVNFWVQLALGLLLQSLHFFTPETRSKVLMDQVARRRRGAAAGPRDPDSNLYGPNEMHDGGRISMKEVVRTWIRPFRMFVTEPIVLCLSLLSGFSDALIFTFMEGFNPVFGQWGFSAWQIGLTFGGIIFGYGLAWASFVPFFRHDSAVVRDKGDVLTPERRLYWLLWLAPLEPLGLFMFAAVSTGPPLPWILPVVAAILVGMANYAIYMATIDYMVAAYGPYAASATGGNALARDVLAGLASFYAKPLFENVGGRQHLQAASGILGGLALVATLPIYVFYWKGEWFRDRSPFAQELGDGSETGSVDRRVSKESESRDV